MGLKVGDGVNELFVYPARVRSSGEFTQAVVHVPEVRAAVEEMRARGVEFEEYDTPETRTEKTVLLERPMEARARGSRTRKATWSASFALYPAEGRRSN